MKFITFLKSQFEGWSKAEIIGFPLVLVLIFICSICLKDSPVALLSAICGIAYTFLAGKGRVICYYIGLVGSFCYVYLSYKHSLFGNACLYMFYYIPMQVLGIFSWQKNLKKDSAEIIKSFLSLKARTITYLVAALVCVIFAYILKIFKDVNPILDSITTILSIFGMYFTVTRKVEQWHMWIVVNVLSFILWLDLFLQGRNVFATMTMWGVYSFLSFYFMFKWYKELKEQNNA